MKFNWGLIMQPNTVVHCDTEDKANELLSEAHKRGLKWSNGSKYTEYNGFNVHESKTCYDFNNNDYGSYGHCKDFKYTILSFNDILIKEENKMKIKYDLQVFHNIILFKVLEMDEKYRSSDKDKLLFTSSNSIVIRSFNSTELYEVEIYVLGLDKTRDDKAEYYNFNTNQEAQAYAEKVRFALEEWNNHVEVMEIEINLDWFEEGKYFKNDGTYSMLFGCGSGSKNILIYDNDIIMKAYWIDSRIPLDKTIIMFNRDCELLNIPFRIKGEN